MRRKGILPQIMLVMGFSATTLVAAQSAIVPHDEPRWMFFYNVTAAPGSSLSTQACKEINTPVHYIMHMNDLEAARMITMDGPDSRYQNYRSTGALYLDKTYLLKTSTVNETFKYAGKAYSTTTQISLVIEDQGARVQAHALWRNPYCQGAYVSEPDESTIPDSTHPRQK